MSPDAPEDSRGARGRSRGRARALRRSRDSIWRDRPRSRLCSAGGRATAAGRQGIRSAWRLAGRRVRPPSRRVRGSSGRSPRAAGARCERGESVGGARGSAGTPGRLLWGAGSAAAHPPNWRPRCPAENPPATRRTRRSEAARRARFGACQRVCRRAVGGAAWRAAAVVVWRVWAGLFGGPGARAVGGAGRGLRRARPQRQRSHAHRLARASSASPDTGPRASGGDVQLGCCAERVGSAPGGREHECSVPKTCRVEASLEAWTGRHPRCRAGARPCGGGSGCVATLRSHYGGCGHWLRGIAEGCAQPCSLGFRLARAGARASRRLGPPFRPRFSRRRGCKVAPPPRQLRTVTKCPYC